MAGHHPFSELRAKITADPARTAKLAVAEQQVAEEQAAYDHAVAEVERARAFARRQLAFAFDLPEAEVTRIERHTVLYLATLRSYLEAMGGQVELVATFDRAPVLLSLEDLFPPREVRADNELAPSV